MKPEPVDHFVNKLDTNCKLTVQVHSTLELKLRTLIGAGLIKLAGRVMGCDIEIVHDD